MIRHLRAIAMTMATLLMLPILAQSLPASSLDLSGRWQVRLDPTDVGESQRWFDEVVGQPIELPGITSEASLGEPLSLKPELNEKVLHHLHQRFRYVGSAWYARTIELDDTWPEEGVELLLERAIWETTVWVNGRKLGSRNSLTTAHRYPVASALKPGKNTIVVRVDNRMKVDIGTIGHAYTEETQSIWNGLIGKIELVRPATIQILSQPLRVKVAKPGMLNVIIKPLNHEAPELCHWEKQVSQPGTFEIPVPEGDAVPWSEFHPALYQIDCDLKAIDTSHHASVATGFRSVKTEETQLLINNKPAFMRGTLECCIFPKTGYPPMDEAGWDKVFGTLKNYGLNHLRFHSWCPPEAAFASADRHGVYVQAELPNWTFEMGKRPETDKFLLEEGKRILQSYAHHPSFVFFSMGNELTGDFRFVDRMVAEFRKQAPHILFTSTTYSFSERGLLPGPEDDFFISQQTQSGWVRGQGFLNQTVPNTNSDYASGLKCLEIPLITHEVGQYNVYPNLEELPKYDGNLRSLALEAIQADLSSKGQLQKASAYTANSGALARILYKEDIERAMRTKGLSGIQLLDLRDFPGQRTATVGMLDAFWDSKGLIGPEEFRRFCSPIVPLARIEKLTWTNQESFHAKMEVANFGSTPLSSQRLHWRITNDLGSQIAEGTTDPLDLPLGNAIQVAEVNVPLRGISKASQMRFEVAIEGTPYVNDWSFWVYPTNLEAISTHALHDVVVIRAFGKPLFDALASGKRVLFLPKREEIRKPLDGRFIPVFWSPVHFPNQPGSLGTLIKDDHPVFADFPTSTHTDWQWWELLANSTSVDLSALFQQVNTEAAFPIMQFIDKFNRNALPSILWECKVGRGSLMVCSLDIESNPKERLVARQLKSSIMRYMSSDRFTPPVPVSPQQLSEMFDQRPYQLRLTKGTSHPDYPLSNASDQDPQTIWHSDWQQADNQFPYHINIELRSAMKVNGIAIAQRTASPNGMIAKYKISASEDGQSWKTIHEAFDPSGQILFKSPVVAKAIRFEVLSSTDGANNCALAEIAPLFDAGVMDVDELGLVEGFNAPTK